jgi:hypothetical protein
VDAPMIQHHDLSWSQRRRQLLGDVPGKGRRIHRSLNQPRLVQAVGGERRDHRRVLGVVTRHQARRALIMRVMRGPRVEPRNPGDVRAAFVDKDELLWVELGRGLASGCTRRLVAPSS